MAFKSTGKRFTGLNLKKNYGIKFGVGDTVDLIKEPSNPTDPNAILIRINGNDAGYVANSDKTIIAGYLGATDLQNEFTHNAKGVVESMANSTGFMDTYIIELFLEEKVKVVEKKKEATASKEINFQVEGSFSLYPARRDLITALASGPQLILLKISGDKILAYFNEDMAGVVKSTGVDEEIYTALKQYVEDIPEAIVKAVGVEKGKVNCELKVNDTIQVHRVKIKDIVERIAKEGINTIDEINEKLEYLRRNKVSEYAISCLLNSYVLYPEDIKAKIPKKPDTVYIDSNGLVAKSVYYMNIKSNLRFEGDRGVGKNVLAETLAWVYNRPLYEFSSNSQHSNNALLGTQTFETEKADDEQERKETAKSFLNFGKIIKKAIFGKDIAIDDAELTGIQKFLYKLLSKGDGKNLKFDRSSIVEAFEVGGIVVLDEFNTALAHVIPIFNSLLDERRRITVPSYGSINAHPNFLAIATENKDYTGTFDANEGTQDRFVPIVFPEVVSIEEILRSKVPSIDYSTVMVCQQLFTGIKDAIRSNSISEKCLSIRGFIFACKVLEQGLPLKDALMDNIANKATDVDDRKSIANMIDLQIK